MGQSKPETNRVQERNHPEFENLRIWMMFNYAKKSLKKKKKLWRELNFSICAEI